jgi:inward rectifier potassium channel
MVKSVIGPYATAPVKLFGVKPDRLKDLYYYLLSTSWPWLILLMSAAFVGVNLLFALGYWGCGGIDNARAGSFLDAFFFSVQTMATIGYGQLAPRSLPTNLLVTLQAFLALISLALMTGLVFAKFSLPSARVRFSRVMVICPHNGRPCLMFRMSNLRLNQIVEARANVAMVRTIVTVEQQQFRAVTDLALERYLNPVFALTWTAIHPITEDSPLAGATPETLAQAATAFVVSLTGLDGTALQNVHARHTYGAEDIRWNSRFVDVLHLEPDGTSTIDVSRLDDVVAL